MDWTKVYAAGEATIVVVSAEMETAIDVGLGYRTVHTIEEAVELKRRGLNVVLIGDVTKFATETQITDPRVDVVLVTYFDEPSVFESADIEVIPPKRREWEDECGMPEHKPEQKKSYVIYSDRRRFVSADRADPKKSIWWNAFIDDSIGSYTRKCVVENEEEARRFCTHPRFLYRSYFVAVGVRVRKYAPIPLIGPYTMHRSTRMNDLFFDSTGMLHVSLGPGSDMCLNFNGWGVCTTKRDVRYFADFYIVVLIDDEPAPEYLAIIFDDDPIKFKEGLRQIENQIHTVPNRSMNYVKYLEVRPGL